jgi:hypothetical protein
MGSAAGMQAVMGKARAGNVDMSTIEGAASRKQTIEECEKDPSQHLRFLLGNGNSGRSEQGSGIANELVIQDKQRRSGRARRGICVKEIEGKP